MTHAYRSTFAERKYNSYLKAWNIRDEILPAAACTYSVWFQREYGESIYRYHERVEARKAERAQEKPPTVEERRAAQYRLLETAKKN